jgi:GT2 family glycosyltransferase
VTGVGHAIRGNDWAVLDGVRPEVPPVVSVVVPYFEQPAELARTLHALGRQTYPRDRIEIIVVDDGSAVAPEVPDDVLLLRQDDEGFRLAAARNRGAAEARGDVLCFLDADCAPEPGYLEELTRLPALASDVVTVGRRRHAALDRLPFDAVVSAAPHELVFDDPSWLTNAYRRSENLRNADARSYRYLIGAVLACHRSFWDEVGGFDEGFRRYGGEDWEWAWRCWAQGAVLAHVPSAVAWHDGPDAAARDRDAAAVNDETRRLEASIPIAGSRPHALGVGTTDTTVTLHGATTSTLAIIGADSVLRRLPTAHVYVGEAVGGFAAIADPRVRVGLPTAEAHYRVHVHAPVRIESEAPLRELLDQVGVESGAIEVRDEDGPLLTITSSRVIARRDRWSPEVFDDRVISAAGIARRLTTPEPSLAAYYGDWD